MFETERLQIRLMEERDIEKIRKLHNHEATLNWLTDPFHISAEEQVLWFRAISTSRKTRRYVLEHKNSSDLCGVIRLDDIDLSNRSATIGADIDPQYRRLGLAFEAYHKIITYLFNDFGLNRLQLLTMESNLKAIALYSKLGFNHEGTLRKAVFREGQYVDLLLMSLLADEWIIGKQQIE